MWNLAEFGLAEMVQLGGELRRLGARGGSMEELAQSVSDHIYESLVQDNGHPALALVRFFKTHAYEGLPSDLQACVEGMLRPEAPWPDLRCLTLLGTRGEHPDWNSRQRSRGHQAIPLRNADFVSRAPMIAALTRQFGLAAAEVVSPRPELFLELAQGTFNVFHVPDAVGSPVVPAQGDFVIPYGVRSVLGVGGAVPTGEIFAVIMFSKVAVPPSVAPLFKPLALNLRAAVLQAEKRTFA